MGNQATVEVPQSGSIGPFVQTDLLDDVAISYGRLMAQTLSEQDGYVLVTLSDGRVYAFGLDTITGRVTTGQVIGNNKKWFPDVDLFDLIAYN